MQVSVDATVTNLTGTPASGGVDGTPPGGTEYYLSAQLMGSSIFTPGDMFVAAVRYAGLSDSNVYVLDLNTRYPLTGDLRVSPRLRLGYRKGTTIDLTEETVLPSVLLNYMWTKNRGVWRSRSAPNGCRAPRTGSRRRRRTSSPRPASATISMSRAKRSAASTWVPCALMVACRHAGRRRRRAGDQIGCTAPAPSAFALEGGLRYWYSSAKNRYDYYADPTPTWEVSRLSYVDLTGAFGRTVPARRSHRRPAAQFLPQGLRWRRAHQWRQAVRRGFPAVPRSLLEDTERYQGKAGLRLGRCRLQPLHGTALPRRRIPRLSLSGTRASMPADARRLAQTPSSARRRCRTR